VVDIYDALTNPRPYKQAYTRCKALEILEQEADRGWRDREITRAFVRMHKSVHAKISEYRAATEGGMPTMGESLANLQSFLTQ
jgi:putative two-component system response regulator